MAKVAFLLDRLPPHQDPVSEFGFALIRDLADQDHDIIVLSSYNPEEELPRPHPRIQVLRPFRRWSLLEIPRALSLLMQFRPDIIHVIQPRTRAAQRLFSAFALLPGMVTILNRNHLVTSFFDIPPDLPNAWSALQFTLALSGTLTASTTPQRQRLRRSWLRRSQRTTVALLPIAAGPVELVPPEGEQILADFSQAEWLNHRPYVLVPGNLDEYKPQLIAELLQILREHEDTVVIFAGGWGQTPMRVRHRFQDQWRKAGVAGRYAMTGQLTSAVQSDLIRRARLVILSGLNPESLTFAQALRDVIRAQVWPILDPQQAEADPRPWLHNRGCWLAEPRHGELARLVLQQLGKSQDDRFGPEVSPGNSELDHPANLMSRIYAQLGTRGRR